MNLSTRHEQQQKRLQFIELLALWEGKVNTNHLKSQFGISRQQASADLKEYIGLSPGILNYSSSLKTYLAAAVFKPKFISPDIEYYLTWLASGQLFEHNQNHNELCAVFEMPARVVEPLVMRGLVSAVRTQQRVEVDYISLTSANKEGRVLAPHSFIKTGLRWHLRAWCERSSQFRDFVLSRFRGEAMLSGAASYTADQDEAWNTYITLIFEPDSRLRPEQRQVLEQDYQMLGGRLHVETRACLAQYVLQDLKVNTKILDGTAEAQQLVLVNRDDIKQWLFD